MENLLKELQKAYGDHACFREGQEEAIQNILLGKRQLVIQKTGWGKSLVYFLAAKILRERNQGLTLIISPLLALMNNQIDSASRLGLRVETINSSNRANWDHVTASIKADQVDALIISPERLANPMFKELLRDNAFNIGLFVIDEAHCISDWGHDFRPDYRRIIDITRMLPFNIPVLATTATANDRVIQDIQNQLGTDLIISRGSLMRESLKLQIIKLKTREERLAWILDNMDRMPGTGIIYCLTVNDCRLVDRWLRTHNIPSRCYYSDMDKENGEDKEETIQSFMENKIKVLAATVAFGMGFDKPDIGFVIHFQKPANLIAYYQQIGRAGRGNGSALAILLSGEEDDEINRYFIDSAFPTENLMKEIVDIIRKEPGLQMSDLEKRINMGYKKIQACVKYLLVEGAIYEDQRRYHPTVSRIWEPDMEKSKKITAIRYKELRQMNDFIHTDKCYMKYIAHVLDDPTARACGGCANCIGHPLLPETCPLSFLAEAQVFVKKDFNIIKPRKKWPQGVFIDGQNKIKEDLLCEPGWVLSNYCDAGWGRIVRKGKYTDNHFSRELVEASAALLKDFVIEHDIRWLTSIPSRRRPHLVSGFARQLAEALNLDYMESLEKVRDTQCQKELNNSFLQHKNAYDSFEVITGSIRPDNVLLVDDMVDSRWTFTVCCYKLRTNNSGKVFPYALANSSGRNEGNS